MLQFNNTKILVKFVFFVFLLSFVNNQTFNIYHTTDVHGWVNGHKHLPHLNADFGDYISFLEHVHNISDENNINLLVHDTGDVVDGTGLSDATAVHGKYILPIFNQLREYYTSATMGNHDVEHVETLKLYNDTYLPIWYPNYLTGNIRWKDTDEILGNTFELFSLKQADSSNINLIVFGFIYNFDHNSDDTIIDNIEDVVTDPNGWFQTKGLPAVKDNDVQMIIVESHIDPYSGDELNQIYYSIRKAYPDIPLVLLSGHGHKLRFKWFDDNSFTIESGKYFQEIGFMSFDLPKNGKTLKESNFVQKWIPTSLKNFYDITNKTEENFLTKKGQALKDEIQYYSNMLNLNRILGCSPMTYKLHQNLTDDNSFYKLMFNEIMPKIVFSQAPQLTNQFLITNDQMLRSNLYEGTVVYNDLFTIDPFNSTFFYYPNLQGDIFNNALTYLNAQSYIVKGKVRDSCYHYTKLPYFIHTDIPIKANTYYNVVCTSYDCQTILGGLNYLYPDMTFNYVIHPSHKSDTTSIEDYIIKYMPCN